MDTSLKYKLMCYRAKEIQDSWNPQIGDYMVAVASYCSDDESNCDEDKSCDDCLESSNTYVISGQTDFVEEIGGRHWYFGGHPCVIGYGDKMNSTLCYTMTKTGNSKIVNDAICSSKDEMLWLPRQDQIQKMFLRGLTYPARVERFVEWLNTATYNAYTYSLEMLWLMYFMEIKYKKIWKNRSDIKRWETINRA